MSTRERMMDVAEALFQSRGYAGVTVEDVTDALGLKKPNLYNHFRDKSDLYTAIRLRRLSRLSTDLGTAIATDGGFTQRVQAVVEALLRNPFFLAAILNRNAESFLPSQTRDILFARLFGAVYEPVTRLLQEGAKSGDISLEPEGIPFAYEALIALTAHFGASEPLECPPERIATLGQRITRLFLRGAAG
jgi:AcrR family transcriptional regulator